MLACCEIWVYVQCAGKAWKSLWTTYPCLLQPCQGPCLQLWQEESSPVDSKGSLHRQSLEVRPPSPALQALVEHYSAAGAPQAVEQAVLHMDIASLDIHQASRHMSSTPDTRRKIECQHLKVPVCCLEA